MAPHEPMQLRGCSGACQQGRMECPHPDACEIPAEEQDSPPLDRAGAFLLVMTIIGAWVAVLGIVHVSRWLYALVSGV